MLLTPSGMTASVACENCGGTRLERDQPSPTHGDGELRNMVDPITQQDQGGNPLQEGVWATTDGGWQPLNRRDESFASVKTAAHEITVTPGRMGIHHQVISLLKKLGDVTINGVHVNDDNKDQIYSQYGRTGDNQPSVQVGAHHPVFAQLAANIVQQSTGNPRDHLEEALAAQQMVKSGQIPAPPSLAAPATPPVQPPVPPQQPGMYAKIAFDFDLGFEDAGPSHLFAVTPNGTVHSAPAEGTTHEQLVQQEGIGTRHDRDNPHRGLTLGALNSDGTAQFFQHETGHSPEALSQMLWGHFGQPVSVDPNLKPTTNEERFGLPEARPTVAPADRSQQLRDEWHNPNDLVRQFMNQNFQYQGATAQIGERSSSMEPYLPWAHEAETKQAFLPLLLGLGGAAAEGGAAGLLGAAAPALMRGALMGAGSNMVQGLMGGGQDAAGQQPSVPPGPRDLSQVAKTADLETPTSNPSLHDNPDGDTKQFDDGSTDTNFENPNNDAQVGGAAQGEDNVGGGIGPEQPTFQPNSPALERANMLLPLLMNYYNSEESGANDPQLRALHEMMEGEVPGYLDGDHDDTAVQQLLQHLRQPDAVHAHTAAPVYQNTPIPPGQIQMGDQQMVMQPGGGLPGVGAQGKCPYCGGTQTADGSCPQCGSKTTPMGGALPNGGQLQSMPPVAPGGVPMQPGGQAVAHTAGDHQGPTTPEQVAAVQRLLIDQGRVEEVPNVPVEPWSYTHELAQVADRANVAPNVDPNQTPPQPAQEIAPPGATMPVPNPADPSMQQAMASVTAADSIARRCPRCGSATTGILNDAQARCHACGNIYDHGAVPVKVARRWKVAAPEETAVSTDPNPVDLPAADQDQPRDMEQEQDSSHSWQDTSGQPLETGQIYQMENPKYKIPDKVRIVAVKPDSLTVSTIGTYSTPDENGQPGDPQEFQHDIPLQEAQMDGLTFTPSDESADTVEDYADQTTQAPVNTEPVASPNTADTPQAVRSHVEDDEDEPDDSVCSKCSGTHIASSMSSPETMFHECYRCGNTWETRESSYGSREGSATAAWLLTESGPGDDFFANYERIQQMKAAGLESGSRSLASIAAKDERLQAVKERLNSNAEARTAGKKYTPNEQRQFIDEQGVARNSDLLDLSGTHYESHRYLGEKVNAENVPDEHMFLGL